MIQYQSFYNYKEGHESWLSAPLFGAYIIRVWEVDMVGEKGKMAKEMHELKESQPLCGWLVMLSIVFLAIIHTSARFLLAL